MLLTNEMIGLPVKINVMPYFLISKYDVIGLSITIKNGIYAAFMSASQVSDLTACLCIFETLQRVLQVDLLVAKFSIKFNLSLHVKMPVFYINLKLIVGAVNLRLSIYSERKKR
jgi:hypothetical protein